MNKHQERQATHAMRSLAPEEQAEIYKFAVDLSDKVEGLDSRDGIEIILMLGQYFAKHPRGVRDKDND